MILLLPKLCSLVFATVSSNYLVDAGIILKNSVCGFIKHHSIFYFCHISPASSGFVTKRVLQFKSI